MMTKMNKMPNMQKLKSAIKLPQKFHIQKYIVPFFSHHKVPDFKMWLAQPPNKETQKLLTHCLMVLKLTCKNRNSLTMYLQIRGNH